MEGYQADVTDPVTVTKKKSTIRQNPPTPFGKGGRGIFKWGFGAGFSFYCGSSIQYRTS
jgi:hypothetical protein